MDCSFFNILLPMMSWYCLKFLANSVPNISKASFSTLRSFGLFTKSGFLTVCPDSIIHVYLRHYIKKVFMINALWKYEIKRIYISVLSVGFFKACNTQIYIWNLRVGAITCCFFQSYFTLEPFYHCTDIHRNQCYPQLI